MRHNCRKRVAGPLALAILVAGSLMVGTSGCGPASERMRVLAFGAAWCGPCRRDLPRLWELQSAGVGLVDYDIDLDPDKFNQYRDPNDDRVPLYVVAIDNRIVFRSHSIDALFRYLDVK